MPGFQYTYVTPYLTYLFFFRLAPPCVAGESQRAAYCGAVLQGKNSRRRKREISGPRFIPLSLMVERLRSSKTELVFVPVAGKANQIVELSGLPDLTELWTGRLA